MIINNLEKIIIIVHKLLMIFVMIVMIMITVTVLQL